jgi:hypothetical protein
MNEIYTGPREGQVLIYEYKIDPEIKMTSELHDFIHDQITSYIKKMIPTATVRVGCNCCYGDGPDLNIICGPGFCRGYIDFDFKIDGNKESL